jgi:phosphoglucan,water dikinase
MDRHIAIGNQTSVSAASATEPFWYAVENQFEAFEWFPDKKLDGAGWAEADLNPENRVQIRETAQAQHIRLSVHARWQVNPLNPECHPILLEDIQLAQDLGAVLLNIHLDTSQGVPTFIRSIRPFIERLAELGMALSIENTPAMTPQDFNQLFAELRALTSCPVDHVGMCLDLGHANLCPATLNDYLHYIDQLDAQVPIIHLHLHENYGDRDSHLPLFTGPASRDAAGIRGLIRRLDTRAFSGSIILEQWPQPPTLLNQARDRLQQMLPEARPPVPAAVEPRPVAPSDFTQRLLEADRQGRSWREKLDAVRGLVADESHSLTTPELVDLAIYLRFLATGEIVCAEDGRHFRPSHHARISGDIQERLSQLKTGSNAFLVRRIERWLPSSAQTFLRTEPLTRIRDIAHRNDIPHHLKQEIKHSLQNKLHRCAGPEDLVTATGLLERITDPAANYSSDFVEQFKIFHAELREFFNARTLEEQLAARSSNARATEVELTGRFLETKRRLGPSVSSHLDCLKSLTELRREFDRQITVSPGSETQEALLADIRLEDFAFVLLSQFANHLGGVAEPDLVDGLLQGLALSALNAALSGVLPEESRAIASDFEAWHQDFSRSDHELLLRLKATADRAKRLAEDFTDHITKLFMPRVDFLGHALGVPDHAIKVFGDAEIRGHVVFQFAKLISELLKYIRFKTSAPPWEVLVPGEATGLLQCADSLAQVEALPDASLVVLLRKAEGDEEIPGKVAAIILEHAIPHLSHLGLRARQAGVVLATGDEPAKIRELERLQNQRVNVRAASQLFSVEVAPEGKAEPAPLVARCPTAVPPVNLKPARRLLPLGEVALENGGAKAVAARRLQELSEQKGSGFKTPASRVVPFGILEQQLHMQAELEARYQQAIGRLDTLPATELGDASEHLRELVEQLALPEQMISEVAGGFDKEAPLIVRSSSNCEDLEGFASAGLYESIATVAAPEIAAAMKKVWASLWTRRATLQRKEAGILQTAAHMALLIQGLIPAEYSFIMHTVNPVNHAPEECLVELAVGLGEVLASAAYPGNPFRLICHKGTCETRMEAFASFSASLHPTGQVVSKALPSAPAEKQAGRETDSIGILDRKTITYSQVECARNGEFRRALGARLAAIARLVEHAFQTPQDVEGAILGDNIYLVQSRTQP